MPIQVSDKYLAEFKELCDKKGIKYDTDAEYREAAYNLLNYFNTLIEIDMERQRWDERLKKEPKGFSMHSEGRSCSLCKVDVRGDIWYDKWGLKCLNCHEAYKKKIVPGYVFRDHDNEKHVTDTQLATISGLHVQTVRKLIRQGKIKARKIPRGPNLILRKDNPNLGNTIDAERAKKLISRNQSGSSPG